MECCIDKQGYVDSKPCVFQYNRMSIQPYVNMWNVVTIKESRYSISASVTDYQPNNTHTSNSQDLELYLYLKPHSGASTKPEILFSALFPYLKPHSGASVNRGNK